MTKYPAKTARDVAASGTNCENPGNPIGGVSTSEMIPAAWVGMNHGATFPTWRSAPTIMKIRVKRKKVRTVEAIVPFNTEERTNATPITHATYARAYAAERPISHVTLRVTARAATVAAA